MNFAIETVVQASLNLVCLNIIELLNQVCLKLLLFFIWLVSELDKISLFVRFKSLFVFYKSFVDDHGSQILFVDIVHEH